MTIKQILDFLECKNQNLPQASTQHSFKKIPTIYVPVIEDEENKLKKLFTFLKKEKLSGKKGEKLEVIHNNQDYYFVGIGQKKDVNSRIIRRFWKCVPFRYWR